FRKEAINTIVRRWFAEGDKVLIALVEVLKRDGDKSVKYDAKTEEYKFPDFISWQAIKDTLEKLGSDHKEQTKAEASSEPLKLWKSSYYENNHLGGLSEHSLWGQFLCVFEYEYQELLKNGHDQKNGESWGDIIRYIEELLQKEQLLLDESATKTIKAF